MSQADHSPGKKKREKNNMCEDLTFQTFDAYLSLATFIR